jgi:hypothetical protein
VAYEDARYSGHALLRNEAPATASAIAAEAQRLARDEPASWEAGAGLLARMGLVPPG